MFMNKIKTYSTLPRKQEWEKACCHMFMNKIKTHKNKNRKEKYMYCYCTGWN